MGRYPKRPMEDKSLTFTDQDLATLKAQMAHKHYSIGVRLVKALVERLEAAEALAWWADYGATYIPKGNLDAFKIALDAWRKAAGK